VCSAAGRQEDEARFGSHLLPSRISLASPAPSVKANIPARRHGSPSHSAPVTVPGNSPLRNWPQGSALRARILLAGSRQANYVSSASLQCPCPLSPSSPHHHRSFLLTTTASAATSTIDPAPALRALEGVLDREPVNTIVPSAQTNSRSTRDQLPRLTLIPDGCTTSAQQHEACGQGFSCTHAH
jgi:hypothetical protein